MGSLNFNYAGLYEYAHITYKRLHKLTSRRRRSAMGETIGRTPARGQQSSPNSQKRANKSRTLAAKSDTACLVEGGFQISLQDLLFLSTSEESKEKYVDFREGRKARSERFYTFWTKMISKQLLLNLKYQITSAVEGVDIEGSATNNKITILPSAFVSVHEDPSLSRCSWNRKVSYVEYCNVRISQQVVAALTWYGSNVPKFGSVMVEAAKVTIKIPLRLAYLYGLENYWLSLRYQ